MYSQISIVKKIEPDAEKFILDNDRMLYLPFFECAEKYCAENSVLIGGKVGLDLVIGRAFTKDSFAWDLYCDDTFNIAKGLADALFRVNSPHVPSATVALSTDIRHKEFTLRINARHMFKIYALDRYRGIKLADLMGPAVRDGYFTKTPIKLISEEMQLIEVYRNLYSPKKLSQWMDKLSAEEKLYNLISDTLGAKSVGSISGAGERLNKHEAEEQILRKIIASSNRVLIGDHALKALGLGVPSRLQFITHENINEVTKSIERVLQNSSRKLRISNIKVTHIRYPLNIPSDFQISKHTIYINGGRDHVPIVDVFNSSAFEMIPWWAGSGNYSGIKVGNPWVLLRFLFIDIWVLRLILNIGTDNPDFIKSRIKAIVANADKVRTLALECVADRPETIFQINNYAGNYIDEDVARKKMIKEIGDRFAPYYPAKSIGGGSEIINREIVSLVAGYKSTKQDFTIDVESKTKILRKIVGGSRGASILSVLKAYHGSAREYSKWGVNKSADKFFQYNSGLFKYVPETVTGYIDLGCGDGLDVMTVGTRYAVEKPICADIADNRDPKYSQGSSLIKLDIGIPMDIPDASVNLVTAFHVIHHAEDAEFRLKDVARVLSPDGVLLLKDHNVESAEDASNVDFEHFVYDAASGDHSLESMIASYHEIAPMWFFSAEAVTAYLISIGFEKLYLETGHGPTKIYRAAFKKL